MLLFINQSFHESFVYATGDPQGHNKIVSIQKKRSLDSVNTMNPRLTMFAIQFQPRSRYNLLSLLYSFSQDTDIAMATLQTITQRTMHPALQQNLLLIQTPIKISGSPLI